MRETKELKEIKSKEAQESKGRINELVAIIDALRKENEASKAYLSEAKELRESNTKVIIENHKLQSAIQAKEAMLEHGEAAKLELQKIRKQLKTSRGEVSEREGELESLNRDFIALKSAESQAAERYRGEVAALEDTVKTSRRELIKREASLSELGKENEKLLGAVSELRASSSSEIHRLQEDRNQSSLRCDNLQTELAKADLSLKRKADELSHALQVSEALKSNLEICKSSYAAQVKLLQDENSMLSERDTSATAEMRRIT